MNSFEGQDYKHKFVNHSKGFVHPEDRTIHTNGIENKWSILRKNIKRNVGELSIESYIKSFLWFYHTNEFIRSHMITKLLSLYPDIFK